MINNSGTLMVDIHCHILPFLDDGPKSWEIALEMCRLAGEDGVEHIVATPHANDRYAYDRKQAQAALDLLRQRSDPKLRFSLGCELFLSYDNLESALANPRNFIIGQTGYLLVELSSYGLPPAINDSLVRLRSRGLVPIIAHPERNPILQRNPTKIMEFVEQGCLTQVTASALTGAWGGVARRSALWLLERGAVHVLASDAHDIKQRPPLLSAARQAVAKKFGEARAHALLEDHPRAILAGQPIPPVAPVSGS